MTISLLINMLHMAVCRENIVGNTCLPPLYETVSELYTLSQKHDLAHLIAHALEKADTPPNEVLSKFKAAKMRAIYRYARMSYEYEQLCQTLEAAQIPFIPLKGAVLREYYPEPWMRTSCDIDVLVQEENLDTAAQALVAQGWRTKEKRSYHDLSLYSPDGIHLELHFQLSENMDNIDPVLARVWEHSAPAAGKQYEHRQSNAFFLFHHLAHMSYHFIAGGCGIRPVLDLWIMNQRIDWDSTEFSMLLKEARLEVFYESVMELVDVWFENHQHTSRTQKMEEYVISGGTYGNLTNKVMVSQARAGGSNENLRQRIIQPYDQLSMYYPVLKRYKFLTPLFQVVRWVRTLLNGRFLRSVYELKINQTNSVDQIEEMKNMLSEIGLDGIKRSSQVQN